MKTKDLIKLLQKNGWKIHGHGANHDVYAFEGVLVAVPRYPQLKDAVVRTILNQCKIVMD